MGANCEEMIISAQLTPISAQLTPISAQLTPISAQLAPISAQLALFEFIYLFFHNFTSRSPILMIFTFLKMILKFIGSSSLFKECGSKNKGAMEEFISNVNFRAKFNLLKLSLFYVNP